MGNLLDQNIVGQIKDIFAKLSQPVEILFFGAENCDYCGDTLQLLREVTAIDEKLSLSIYDLQKDADAARKFNVDKAPGIVVAAKSGEELVNYGIQYSGIPSGHEFSTLINDILMVSSRDSGLSEQTREFLRKLEKPVHMQVFVTPSCPYCPQAVLLAHQMSMENPAMIRAEGVEATEFPELAQRFHVSGVPQTTINAGAATVVGAVPEKQLLSELMRVLAN
ncbi:MAG: thioredoxin family protein [Chloroflexota bacterium]